MPKIFHTSYFYLPVSLVILLLLHTSNPFKVSAETKCASQDYFEDHYEECSNLIETTSKKLEAVKSQKNSINDQIQKYLSTLTVTDAQINDLKAKISEVEGSLSKIEENLSNRKGSLEEKTQMRNKIIRSFYQMGRINPVEFLFFTPSGESSSQSFVMRDIFEDTVAEEAIKQIISLNTEIKNFEKDKEEASRLRSELEDSKNKLLSLKADIDRKKAEAQSEVIKLEEKSQSYEEMIDKLSSLQSSILAAKSGDQSGSVGDYEPPESKLPDPKFSPAFVGMSYGAYTHYKGMSQYGAKGRAEDGKDYKEILKFYYNADTKKVDNFPSKISVSGYGNLDFQYYLYGIAEMPSSWPEDALKAQAIAARTYAYAYAKSGKTICTTQACQVFLSSKANNPPSAWKDAVDDTKGVVLDSSVTAYYSASSGGYIEGIGWDVKGNWPGNAYEKKGGSPWFYKAWYTKSYNDSSNCGRSDPYLTEKEMADILNAITVWEKGSSSDRNKISPVTTSCWGGSPYSLDKMKDRADELGDAYSSISSVDVEIGNNGQTTSVKFSTDKGNVSIKGDVFKTVFNLRAPGYISLKSRLYEIVKK